MNVFNMALIAAFFPSHLNLAGPSFPTSFLSYTSTVFDKLDLKKKSAPLFIDQNCMALVDLFLAPLKQILLEEMSSSLFRVGSLSAALCWSI